MTAIRHRIIVAVVDGRMGSTRQLLLQMDWTWLLVAMAIASATATVADRQQMPGSAIKHNNFCAFWPLLVIVEVVFYYNGMAFNFPSNLF